MPRKLILAEDSLTIRRVFELALSRSDIAITAVDNGEDAVRLAGEISPDLVIADLTLPGKNGYAVAAELRAMAKTEKIPVLILSGTLAPLDEERFRASGAKGVLFKPFDSRELTEKVELLLRESAAVPEPASVGREELLPGAVLHGGSKIPAAFNEFDVSLDEIEGTSMHIEASVTEDAPPPVTDLSRAVEEVEEIEEIEPLEDVEAPLPPPDTASMETPASLRILPAPPEPSSAASGRIVEEPAASAATTDDLS
ncbi:MAG TPA: response regulator, partial [Candidatus Methylomirabilis sp.]|nr:response regulator [Candidatus Methylomirabilis sp.]